MAKKSNGASAKIGDDAVKAATGKGWDNWFRIIDRAGGRKMDHKQIVAVVSKQKGSRPWWQQMVTVEYERARGLREVHETTAGYQISRSKTLDVPITNLFKAWKDPKSRSRWLGDAALAIRSATTNKYIRITWPDGKTNVEVNFYKTKSGKSQVTVQHNKLADAKSAAKMKTYWGKKLERLTASF
jgi:uncharacterized protein YndB with AHSA1/START domain